MAAPGRTREAIVAAADELFYRQGYEHASFTAIAERTSISRGNIFHHFRAKDELLDAVIASRVQATRQMLRRWEAQEPSPAGRIECFARIVLDNGEAIRRSGCPAGTLASELAKLDHPLVAEARGVLGLFREWLRAQFEALGHGDRSDALAMHVLAFSQGVATLLNAFGDEAFAEREVERLLAWLTALRPGATEEETVREGCASRAGGSDQDA